MKKDIAISVKDVTKDFHLPRHASNSVKDSVLQVFKKKDKGVDVHHALKGVSFEIKRGEFFGILGRNGSGKSTLLKIISEIYQPTSGTVQHRGSLVSFIELGVGFKPQLTGRENVYLSGALLGFSKIEMDERYDEIVQFAELEEFMGQKLKNYSSGMKVRLAFSVAIQAKSDILVLDEVLAVGDASFQKKCYEYFDRLKEDASKTIVFVSHSMSAVKKYCDRAILIENGHVGKEGASEEVSEAYTNLFNHPPPNNSKIDHGTKKIELLTVESRITKDMINLELEFEAKEEIKDLVIGVRFVSGGRVILGTTTEHCEPYEAINMSTAQRKKISISLDNYITSKSFYLGLTMRSLDFSVEYGNWDQVALLINPREVTKFPVTLPGKLNGLNAEK